ncbi:unnamed protein product [Timema podura]|uniref:26S proteasome complex subunit SEM1 n=1 Tax=Timema podura TaxID=61482 RepID=A0ABN7P5Z5_TIMPD|nr:unnamed protein product [Timema podura]
MGDWTGKDEDEEDVSVWEDNWDDDNVEDDFSLQLSIADVADYFRSDMFHYFLMPMSNQPEGRENLSANSYNRFKISHVSDISK